MTIRTPLITAWSHWISAHRVAKGIGSPRNERGIEKRLGAMIRLLEEAGFVRFATETHSIARLKSLPIVGMLGSREVHTPLLISPSGQTIAEPFPNGFWLMSELSDGTVASTRWRDSEVASREQLGTRPVVLQREIDRALGMEMAPAPLDKPQTQTGTKAGWNLTKAYWEDGLIDLRMDPTSRISEGLALHESMVANLCAAVDRRPTAIDLEAGARMTNPKQDVLTIEATVLVEVSIWALLLALSTIGLMAWAGLSGLFIAGVLGCLLALVLVPTTLMFLFEGHLLQFAPDGGPKTFHLVENEREAAAARKLLQGEVARAERMGFGDCTILAERYVPFSLIFLFDQVSKVLLTDCSRLTWPLTLSRYAILAADRTGLIMAELGKSQSTFSSFLASGKVLQSSTEPMWSIVLPIASETETSKGASLFAIDPAGAFVAHRKELARAMFSRTDPFVVFQPPIEVLRHAHQTQWTAGELGDAMRQKLRGNSRARQIFLVHMAEIACLAAGFAAAYWLVFGLAAS